MVEGTDDSTRPYRFLPRARVPHEGKWVKANNVPIGMPILHTAEEWEELNLRNWRRMLARMWLIALPLSFLILLPYLVVMGVPFWPNAITMASVVALAFPLTMTVWTPLFYRRVRRRGISSGLYENGLVIAVPTDPSLTFIPYWMVEEAEFGPFNLVNRMQMLRVRIKGFKMMPSFDVARILGEEGLAVLRYRILRTPVVTVEGPPELHVYGGRGLRISSIPCRPGNGGGDGPG
jgi:hypothetical protein